MYRKLASAILVASAINAKYALALGLGGMTMHSALNQPLDAEISLSSAGDLDKSQILINLASQEDFLKAGVDRSFFLSDIKFDVVLDGKGGGIIKLRSTKRLNEPYLDFLIEAKWPTGRMLRSYTALVDLPVYADEKASQVDVGAGQPASAVESAETSYSSTVQTSRPASSSVSAAQPAASRPAAPKRVQSIAQPSYSGNEYQIKPNDTLSHIARKLKTGSDVSVNQTMLAIQKLNPHAFVRNNINLIKAGVVLRVPTEADVRQISASTAAVEVAEQTREWRGAQLDATDAVSAPVAMAPEKEEGRLRLTSAGSGLANGKDKAGTDAGTQQKLNATEESLEASKLENKDLNTRVKSLDSQVSQLQRMIELKDAELAALQKKLGKEPVAGTKEAKEIQALADKIAAENAKVKPVETKPEIVAAAGQPEPVTEAASQPAEAKAGPKKPVSKPKPEKPVQPKEEPAPEPGFIDQIKANPLYIGGVALLLIFGVVAFLFRRKAQAERQAMTENDIGNFDFDRAVDHEGAIENLPTEEEVDEFAALADTGHELAEHESDESQATVMQTTDPVGEADIYIAYGRYDQAAELLLNAIAASPKNAELRTKLLEVYLESKNKAGFQQQYLDLRALGQSAAVSHAKELLTSGGVADWLDDLPVEESSSGLSGDETSFDNFGADLADSDDNNDFDLETDIDLSGSGFGEEARMPVKDEAVPDTGESFDLDLSDMDLAGDDFSFAETVEEAPAKVEESDFDADLSLDLSDLDLESTDTDLSFDLETSEATAVSESDELDMGDLSFDLPDDFGAESLEEPVQTASLVEEPLSFDDLDMGFAEPVAAATAVVSADDDLSFEGFDLELPEEESVPAASMAEEDSSLDFSDMDFGLDDGSGLVSSGSGLSEEGFDLSVEETPPAEELALESDFEFASVAETVTSAPVEEVGIETAAAEPVAAEPHVSSPIATLESEDLEFLTDGDEVSTKLDLAQAYVDLGDIDGARDILLEVMKEGRDEQKAEAAALLDSLD